MPDGRRIISSQALADVKSIEDYIAEHDGEARADKFTARIDKVIDMLAFMPGIGSRRDYLDEDVRAFPVPPWVIYYAPLPGGDGVEIVRVVDGRRDRSAIFKAP